MYIESKRSSEWINESQWECKRHLRKMVFSKTNPRCEYHSCSSVRPSIKLMPKKPEENNSHLEAKNTKSELCSFDKCKNPVGQNRKKYCSDNCRKKYARQQYRLRQKAKK
jgi:hypothetical protein